MMTLAQIKEQAVNMTKSQMIQLRDEMGSNWSESLRPSMNALSLACINKFNCPISQLEEEQAIEEITTPKKIESSQKEIIKQDALYVSERINANCFLQDGTQLVSYTKKLIKRELNKCKFNGGFKYVTTEIEYHKDHKGCEYIYISKHKTSESNVLDYHYSCHTYYSKTYNSREKSFKRYMKELNKF